LQWSTDSNAILKSVKIVSTWVDSLKISRIKEEKTNELVEVERMGKNPCWSIDSVGNRTLSILLVHWSIFPIKGRLFPHFNVGVLLLVFQTDGNLPSLKDLLKIEQWI